MTNNLIMSQSKASRYLECGDLHIVTFVDERVQACPHSIDIQDMKRSQHHACVDESLDRNLAPWTTTNDKRIPEDDQTFGR
jgi:hypothetical protein